MARQSLLSPGLSLCQEPGDSIPELKDQRGEDVASLNCPTPLQRGLGELWVSSMRRSLLIPLPRRVTSQLCPKCSGTASWLVACRLDPASSYAWTFLGAEKAGPWQRSPAQAGQCQGGEGAAPEAAAVPQVTATPLSHWGLWEEGELLGGGCMFLQHHLLPPPESPLIIPPEEKLK